MPVLASHGRREDQKTAKSSTNPPISTANPPPAPAPPPPQTTVTNPPVPAPTIPDTQSVPSYTTTQNAYSPDPSNVQPTSTYLAATPLYDTQIDSPTPTLSQSGPPPSSSSGSSSTSLLRSGATPTTQNAAAGSTATSISTAHQRSSVRASVVAGSVFGALILLVLLALGGIFFLKRWRRNHTAPSAMFKNVDPAVSPFHRITDSRISGGGFPEFQPDAKLEDFKEEFD